MKILSRYIIKEAAAYFVVSLITFTGILLTLRMLRLASLIINKGVELKQIAIVFFAIVPAFMEVAIPLATMLGVMLAFGRLSGDSEIIVMRSSGISITQLVRPILLFGLFCGTLSFAVTQTLSPWGFRVLSRTLFEIARSKSTAGLEPGVFNKLGDMTLYTEKIDYETGALERVLIDDKRSKDERKIITAKTGEIVSNEEERTITLRLFDGQIHEELNPKYVITAYDTNSVELNSDEIFNTDSQSRGASNRELTRPQLEAAKDKFRAMIADYEAHPEKEEAGRLTAKLPGQAPFLSKKDLQRKIRRLNVEEVRRFSMPYASFILALMALPLGIQLPRSQKTWGAGLSAAMGLGVFVIYYGLLSTGVALAEGGRLSPYLALWIPNIVVTIIAAVSIWKIGTEQWQSMAQRLEDSLRPLVSRIQARRAAKA
ncbi:MAG: LPS export ABC transporter permease LptF [Deltaproteobacteria bacterium]|nr:LPS export ABC transporter permease LptF [Deltaproteobacteria bacterium]